mmetsp:Transcript_37757/g.95661  ORF Transcript_37757/g.95661 Transcript_37757/m.95661 type:complete len:338 (+) Transcript_37757:130-1143(+)
MLGAARQVSASAIAVCARLAPHTRLLSGMVSRQGAAGKSLSSRAVGTVQSARLWPALPLGCLRHFCDGVASSASAAESAPIARTKPHPMNPRFAYTNKPFFPIWTGNLRDVYYKKRRKKIGKGMKGKGGERLKHARAQRKNSKTWEHGADPLFRRIPKWPAAHKHMTRKKLETLNLAKLRYYIEKGRIDTRFTITQRHLYDSGCVSKVRKGVSLFNVNDFPFPYKIDIEVAGADQSSIDMLKAVGGSVTIIYMEPVTLRAHIKPWKFEVLPRTARPTMRMVSYMEKMKAKGAIVRYIKPMWLIEEERRLQAQLRELRGEDGHIVAERLARADERLSV